MNYFKSNIKVLRKKKGLTQTDLAKKLNLVKSSICSYETGVCYPPIPTLIEISKILKVSIDKLLTKNLLKV